VRLEEQLRRLEDAGPSTYMKNVRWALKLAKNLVPLYKKASVEEKRRILNLVCSNWRLVGKKLDYQMKTPFAELAEGRSSGKWLPVCGAIQTWAARADVVLV
jgi:hypothetical protein